MDWSTDTRARAAPALIAAVLALAGCSGVASPQPWFGPADTAGAPRLREGVWRVDGDPDKPCSVDEARPPRAWPDCAIGLVARSADLLHLTKGDNGAWTWEPWPYLIAAGAPPIMQLEYTDSSGGSYLYLWLRPEKLDGQGRAVAIRGWRVECGPPPKPDDGEKRFYPGLTAAQSDCLAASAAALRAAATSTEADDPANVFHAHWVRDGDR